MINHERLDALSMLVDGMSAHGILETVSQEFRGRAAFATSLGLEDQVITHIIAENDLDIPIFTLDTGRLFGETYDLIDRTERRFGIRLSVYSPDTGELERMVAAHGVNLFRDSVAARRRCCAVRKLGPLDRALENLDAWVCGLRREQSAAREHIAAVEWDETNDLFKFNPLVGWSEHDVRAYVERHGVPYNVLHDAGFPSIGCAPCTRAVARGEDPRSGRWWWENDERRECGLHGNDSHLEDCLT